MTREQQNKIESKILDLIDSADEYTRGDLQGVVTVLVWDIARMLEKPDDTNKHTKES
jgi:hypothetical protein